MKTALFVLCLLCAGTAMAQSGGAAILSNSLQFSNHTSHAAPTALASEQDLWGGSGSVVIAQGERPVGEVVPEKYEMPLGDAARLLRKEHSTAKKSSVCWENKAWGPGVAQLPAR